LKRGQIDGTLMGLPFILHFYRSRLFRRTINVTLMEFGVAGYTKFVCGSIAADCGVGLGFFLYGSGYLNVVRDGCVLCVPGPSCVRNRSSPTGLGLEAFT